MVLDGPSYIQGLQGKAWSYATAYCSSAYQARGQDAARPEYAVPHRRTRVRAVRRWHGLGSSIRPGPLAGQKIDLLRNGSSKALSKERSSDQWSCSLPCVLRRICASEGVVIKAASLAGRDRLHTSRDSSVRNPPLLCRVRKILIIEGDRDTLVSRLNELGSNVVLLDKDIREKLRGTLKEFPDLALTMSVGSTLGSAASFDTFTAFDTLSLGDSFDSGGAFGGFGDGDLGGGGACGYRCWSRTLEVDRRHGTNERWGYPCLLPIKRSYCRSMGNWPLGSGLGAHAQSTCLVFTMGRKPKLSRRKRLFEDRSASPFPYFAAWSW